VKKLKGKAFIFGHDIDTHEILAARYLSIQDSRKMAEYCMRDVDPEFARRVQPGDMIVAGKNFGCGSGHEQAARALKDSGLSCIIARSFGRIFFRNAINIGLPILECPEAFESVNQGDEMEVQIGKGKIVNKTKDENYQAKDFPPMLEKIIESGGLMQAIRKKTLR